MVFKAESTVQWRWVLAPNACEELPTSIYYKAETTMQWTRGGAPNACEELPIFDWLFLMFVVII